MNADKNFSLIDADLTRQVIGIFYSVYNELGRGFAESVYENAMAIALGQEGLQCAQQQPLTVWFRGEPVGEFRTDLLVGMKLVVELKAVARLTPAHEAQLINYLKATDIPVGLLLNFGDRPEFKRLIFSDSPKQTRNSPFSNQR
ncbi:MAG: GxxExxY protein [Xanthomonadales bacterium]|nr:GxxExxY protein [Xanthomonadales bacterium]|tara:strand:+ start:266 stop:697 length:432 start_codon:yes stop_codon:yes gene_type:complete